MTNISASYLELKRLERAAAANHRVELAIASTRINREGRASGISAQALPAIQVRQCLLFANKRCQQSQWCHDKVQLQKAYVRAQLETSEAHARQGSESLMTESIVSARLARATSPALRELRELRKCMQKHPDHARFASSPKHAGQVFLNLLPAPARLPWLEILQALARGRCFLLRTCVVPFYKLPLRIKRTPIAGDRE
jgi:hypothetical protein